MPPGSKEFDSCGVCRRTILRGERVAEYIASDGTTVGVCALCKGAAEDAGWVPAALAVTRGNADPKRRRGLGLRRRLTRVSSVARGLTVRPAERSEGDAEEEPAADSPTQSPAPPPSSSPRGPNREAPPERSHTGRRRGPGHELDPGQRPRKRPSPERILRGGVEAFNASAEPRKVAGLIRSLGEPQVTVRASSGGAMITIAWELSWYQWQVGGEENGVGVRETGKGGEVSELDERDRRWNATAAADGTIALDLAAARGASSEAPSESG